jgi:hypothetical protein
VKLWIALRLLHGERYLWLEMPCAACLACVPCAACEHKRALQIATRYMYHDIMFTYVDANSVGHSANLISLPWYAMQDAVD